MLRTDLLCFCLSPRKPHVEVMRYLIGLEFHTFQPSQAMAASVDTLTRQSHSQFKIESAKARIHTTRAIRFRIDRA